MGLSESPRSQLYEELALRDELQTIISDHYTQGDFIIVQDENLSTSAEVMFAGKLRAKIPGKFLDVEVTDVILYDDEKVLMVSLGDFEEYQIASDGIISSVNTEFQHDKQGLMALRFWIRETEWSCTHTETLLQKRQSQT
jgi:hypothetical protein